MGNSNGKYDWLDVLVYLVAAGSFFQFGLGALTRVVSPSGFFLPFTVLALVEIAVGILGLVIFFRAFSVIASALSSGYSRVKTVLTSKLKH